MGQVTYRSQILYVMSGGGSKRDRLEDQAASREDSPGRVLNRWQVLENHEEQKPNQLWTGRTILNVDRVHSLLYGMGQGQQQSEASNRKRVSWASSSD